MTPQEVITLALRSNTSIEEVLKATLALAEETGDANAVAWLNEELHGYALQERIPAYREVQNVAAYFDYGDYVPGMRSPNPTWELGRWSEEHAEFGNQKVALKDSAPLLEKLGHNTRSADPPYSTRMPDGYVLTSSGKSVDSSYGIIQRPTLLQVVTEIRKRVLDWAGVAAKRDESPTPARPRRRPRSKGQVFIVHGHNHAVRDAIDLYLTKDLGVRTLVMQAGPSGGRTLPEKLEEIARDTSFAIFIMTADDALTDARASRTTRRARQNVVLEIGYFWALLGRHGGVAFLVDQHPDMELPSDLDGLELIPITADLGQTKLQLKNELQKAGIIK